MSRNTRRQIFEISLLLTGSVSRTHGFRRERGDSVAVACGEQGKQVCYRQVCCGTWLGTSTYMCAWLPVMPLIVWWMRVFLVSKCMCNIRLSPFTPWFCSHLYSKGRQVFGVRIVVIQGLTPFADDMVYGNFKSPDRSPPISLC